MMLTIELKQTFCILVCGNDHNTTRHRDWENGLERCSLVICCHLTLQDWVMVNVYPNIYDKAQASIFGSMLIYSIPDALYDPS